jgi:hypothetical protein
MVQRKDGNEIGDCAGQPLSAGRPRATAVDLEGCRAPGPIHHRGAYQRPSISSSRARSSFAAAVNPAKC